MAAENLIIDDTRKPVAGYCTYNAPDIRPNPFVPRGPNAFGERLWPVTVEYVDGKTRVGWAYTEPVGDYIE